MKKVQYIFLALFGIMAGVNSQGFYDINTVNTIGITFEESNWDYLLDQLVSAGQGGFHKTTDQGENWTEINSGIQSDANVATWIVNKQSDPDILFGIVGKYQTYFTVYKSLDAGNNWIDMDLHTTSWEPLSCLSVHPENDDVIYVGGNTPAKAIYFTITGGNNWELATNNYPLSSTTSFSEMFQINDGYSFCASTYSASAHIMQAVNLEFIALDGLVTDFSGTPIADAIVVLDGEMAEYELLTNEQGTFEIPEFVVGTYAVLIEADGHNTYSESLEITQPTTLEIELSAPIMGADVTIINGAVSPDSYNSTSFEVSNTGSGPLEWHSSINFESEYGDVILEMDNLYSQVPEGSGFFGCEFDGENFWVVCTGAESGYNHHLCKFDLTGTLLETYDQNIDSWGLRGIYYHSDGYLYGGSNVGFHRIDPADGSITLLFEDKFGLSCIRGLTYVPLLGGFVARDYDTDFVIFDVDGNFLGSIPKPEGLSSTVADIDYDPIHDCIWMYDRSGTANTTFYQYSISAGELTDVVIDVPLFGGLTSQKAGGSFFSSTLVPGKYVLGAVSNSATPQDVLFAVDIFHHG